MFIESKDTEGHRVLIRHSAVDALHEGKAGRSVDKQQFNPDVTLVMLNDCVITVAEKYEHFRLHFVDEGKA